MSKNGTGYKNWKISVHPNQAIDINQKSIMACERPTSRTFRTVRDVGDALSLTGRLARARTK